MLGGRDANVPRQVTQGLHAWANVVTVEDGDHSIGNAPPAEDTEAGWWLKAVRELSLIHI